MTKEPIPGREQILREAVRELNGSEILIARLLKKDFIAGEVRFDKWEELLEKLSASGISLTDPLFVEAYRWALISRHPGPIFRFWKKNLKVSDEALEVILDHLDLQEMIPILKYYGDEKAPELLHAYAVCLLEEKGKKEKALKYCKGACEINPINPAYFYTAYKISKAMGENEKAWEFLARSYKRDTEYIPAQEAYRENRGRLEVYWDNYWKENKKETILRKILAVFSEIHGGPEKEVIAYILGKSEKLTYTKPVPWVETAEALIREFFDMDDPYLLNIYKGIITYEKPRHLFRFFHRYYGHNTPEGMRRIVELLKKTPLDKIKVIALLIDTYGGKSYSTAILRHYFLPEYRRAIENYMIHITSRKREKRILLEMLLADNYGKYASFLKKEIMETPLTKNVNGLLALTAKPREAWNLYVTRLRNFLEQQLTANRLHEKAIRYIKKGRSYKELEPYWKSLKIMLKQANISFHALFLSRLPEGWDRGIVKRLLRTGVILDPAPTLDFLFLQNRIEGDPERLQILEKEYELPEELIWDFLVQNHYKTGFQQILRRGFRETPMVVKKAILLQPPENRLSLLDLLWEENPEESCNLLLAGPWASGTSVPLEQAWQLLTAGSEKWKRLLPCLEKKEKHLRIAAINILAGIHNPEVVKILQKRIETEPEEEIRIRIKEIVKQRIPCPSFLTEEQLTERALSSGEWKNFPLPGELPEVRWRQSKARVPDEVIRYMAHFFNRPLPWTSGREEAEIKALLEKESMVRFLGEAYEALEDSDQLAWVVSFMTIYPEEIFVRRIEKTLAERQSSITAKQRERLLIALGAMGTEMSLKGLYRLYFKNPLIKEIAEKALETGAAKWDVTRDELLDLLVPDFGLLANGTRVMDYGSRKFLVALTADFRLKSAGKNKEELPDLPPPEEGDDQEKAGKEFALFREMQRELPSLAAREIGRLEQAVIDNRKWRMELWSRIFIEKPVMREIALALVWGAYKGDELIESFRLRFDGICRNIEEEPCSFPPDYAIGIVHPVELSPELIDRWDQNIKEENIHQPFQQITRPYYLQETESGEKQEKLRIEEPVSPKREELLRSRGWKKGEGFYQKTYSPYGVLFQLKKHPAEGILELKSYKLSQNPERLNWETPLKMLSPRLFSEVQYELKQIFNPPKETL